MPAYYLSNCNVRAHARMYGSGAFYDLGITGHQANLATDLTKGQTCVVATPTKDGNVAFEWFRVSRIAVRPDDEGISCRVFFGNSIKEEKLTKRNAARHSLYSIFFNKNGDFKRGHSVLRSK